MTSSKRAMRTEIDDVMMMSSTTTNDNGIAPLIPPSVSGCLTPLQIYKQHHTPSTVTLTNMLCGEQHWIEEASRTRQTYNGGFVFCRRKIFRRVKDRLVFRRNCQNSGSTFLYVSTALLLRASSLISRRQRQQQRQQQQQQQ